MLSLASVGSMAVGSMAMALLAPISMLASTPEEVAAPDGVSVELVTVNGSGCPLAQGTAVLSRDRTSLRVTTPAYAAWAGGAAGPTDFRKNCQASVYLSKPPGWTFAVSRVDSSGFAHLAPAATGLSRVSVYFQGTSPTATTTATFSGPMSDSWSSSGAIDIASLIFAPCGEQRNLNLNTEVRVNAGADRSVSSFMVRDPVTTYRLVWKTCPA